MNGEMVATSARALNHPLRVQILELLTANGEKASPNELAVALGAPLGNVAYHVRQLHGAGVLVGAGTAPRRGAVEHYYRLGDSGVECLKALRAATGELLCRSNGGGGVA